MSPTFTFPALPCATVSDERQKPVASAIPSIISREFLATRRPHSMLVLATGPTHPTFQHIFHALVNIIIPVELHFKLADKYDLELRGTGKEELTSGTLNAILDRLPVMRGILKLKSLTLSTADWQRAHASKNISVLELSDVTVEQDVHGQTGFNNVLSIFSLVGNIVVRTETGNKPSKIKGTDQEVVINLTSRNGSCDALVDSPITFVLEDVTYSRNVLAALWTRYLSVKAIRVAVSADNLALLARFLGLRNTNLEDLALDIATSDLDAGVNAVNTLLETCVSTLGGPIRELRNLNIFTICIHCWPPGGQSNLSRNSKYWWLANELIKALPRAVRLQTVTIEFVCHYEQDLVMKACAIELQALVHSLNALPPVCLVFTASQHRQDGRPGVAGMSARLYDFVAYTLNVTSYHGVVELVKRDRV